MTIKILFWNLLGGNPVSKNSNAKHAEIQQELINTGADIILMCEVTDQALDELDIASLKRYAAVEFISTRNGDTGLMPDLSEPMYAIVRDAVQMLGMVPSGRRSSIRFDTGEILQNAQKMSMVVSANQKLEIGTPAMALVTQMKNPSISSELARVDVPPILKVYPYWQSLESDQKGRSYIAFGKKSMAVKQHEVEVKGSRRNIIDILYDGRLGIYSVHAPAFAKGGAETVQQLCTLVKKSNNPSYVAVGDFNVDMDEAVLEAETELASSHQCAGMFSRNSVTPHGPAMGKMTKQKLKRRWHPYKPDIEKKTAQTQKRGGTLDYALAKDTMQVSTKIVANESFIVSDHAAIMVEVEL